MKWCGIIFYILFAYIGSAQTITTYAGGGSLIGDGGPATVAILNRPGGGAFDKYGNYYVVEFLGHRVRKISPSGIISRVAGTGLGGFSGDGGPATAAQLNEPSSIAVDTSGNIYIADLANFRIRKIDGFTGIISTIAGNGSWGFFGEGVPSTAAQITTIEDVCLDKFGNVYFTDRDNYRIRKINTSGIITTVAGSGTFSSTGTGDGGPATLATFNFLTGVTVDDVGNLYIADFNDAKVRKVSTMGIITTVAGNGLATYSGDGIPATNAQFNPFRLAFDNNKNLVIADKINRRVYRIDKTSDILDNIAGNGGTGSGGDGGPATAASLDFPSGVAYDDCGNLYIAESIDKKVRKVNSGTSSIPSVIVSSSTGSIVCTGTSVTYTATISNGGKLPTYNWYVNGLLISTGSSFTYTPANNDSIRCVLTSSSPCAMPSVAYSNSIKMAVSTVVPTVSISVSPGTTICAGTSATFTAAVTGGGSSPAYKWYVNGAVVGTSSSTYTYTPANNDSIRCVCTSSSACASPAVVYSGSIIMSVSPLLMPVITIAASPGSTVCAGTPVTYSASIIAGGSSPIYKWYVNGLLVSSLGSTYSYTPAKGDSIYCALTSSYPCSAVAAVRSNVIKMIVDTTVMPSITITASPRDTICTGSAASFSSTTINGGASPSFQWFVNGSSVGTAGSYTYVPSNADAVYCVLTGSALCSSPTVVNSNTLTIQVDTHTTPSISISGITSAPAYSTVTVTATVAGASGGYFIRWFNDGFPIAVTTDTSIIYSKVKEADHITATIVTASGGCIDSSMSGVHVVSMSNTGINDLVVSQVHVFPNPSTGVFGVTAPVKIKSVSVSNLVGKVLYDKDFNTNVVEVNIGSLPKGVYIVQVLDMNGSKTIRKIVSE